MSGVGVSVKGPLSEGDPASKIQRSTEELIRKLAEMGEQRLKSSMPAGVPVKSGNYRRHIHAMVQGSRAQLDDSGVVYGSWLEGTSSRNETTRFKGYSTFRRTRDWLQDKAGDEARKTGETIAVTLGG